MIRQVVAILSVVGIGVGIGATSARAEETHHRCYTCVTATDGLGNQGYGYGAACSIPGNNCVDCDVFLSCISGGSGYCPEPACGLGAELMLKEVQDAVRRGGEPEVISVAQRNPDRVRVTEDGYALVLNCKGGVVSSTRLITTTRREAVARLDS